jgi:anti-sigma regulatory factor (Ser/Thr protein kinase)
MPFLREDNHLDQHNGDRPATQPDLHYPAIPAQPELLGAFRRILAHWAANIGMTAERVQALTLATYEAMANAVTHAYHDRPGTLELHATYLPRHHQVTITVTDHGHWRPTLVNTSPLRPDGRGLGLIRALAEDTTITAGTEGTSVRMHWHT